MPEVETLDNCSNVSFGCTRFETVIATDGLNRDLYVSLLILLFNQPFTAKFKERTRRFFEPIEEVNQKASVEVAVEALCDSDSLKTFETNGHVRIVVQVHNPLPFQHP